MSKIKDIEKEFCGIPIGEARRDWETIEKLRSKYTKHIEDFSNQSKAYKEFGFDLEWNDFARMVKACFTPQSYGGRIQNRHIKKIGAIKISSKDNSGDFKEGQEAKEYKASIITGTNSNINVVQIRQKQGVSYRITAVDLRDWNSPKTYTFDLTHEQMEKELTSLKATSAHGTTEAIKNNENVEKRFSIDLDSDVFKRWCSNYLVDNKSKY